MFEVPPCPRGSNKDCTSPLTNASNLFEVASEGTMYDQGEVVKGNGKGVIRGAPIDRIFGKIREMLGMGISSHHGTNKTVATMIAMINS